jgi:hypothetical protein
MKNKFGILQSTATSCIFYKQDVDGNQSTFNIFVTPEKTGVETKKIYAFIDNEQFKQKNWFGMKDIEIKDVFEAFQDWASDAPFLFEIDAHKSLGHCLGTTMKQGTME